MIDMHCHIIPYTDDGAVDLNTSLEMARLAKNVGYTGIFATSHYIIPDNELINQEYIQNIEKLNRELEKENIDIKIYNGNEIFFTNDIASLVKEHKVCTLGDSRYVLVELPLYNNIIPMNVYEEFNKLQDQGYIPILAHPERYDFVTKDVKSLIPLIESGVLLQSNIGSIIGRYGKNPQKNIKKMLKLNMVHLFGTDSHTTSVYEVYEKAMNKIKKTLRNDEMLNIILNENPNKILNNEEISIWYPKNK